ncbi:MAG: ACT domain-containing protein [Candidatus Bipolaricaulota bacterium]
MREVRLVQELVVSDADRVGLLADVTRLLRDMGINVNAIAVRVSGDEVSLHLLTPSQTYAREALREAGLAVKERDVIAMELPHHVGFLCRMAEALARRDLTIVDLYSSTPDDAETGLVVFSTSNNLHAMQILRGR